MRNSKRWLAAILAGAMIAVTGCSGSASKQETTAAETTVAETTAEETTAAETTAEAKEGETTTFVDDLGREVELELPVTRACVANRYNNELIRAVGAGDAVVGVDQYTSQDPVYWPQFGEDETFGKDEYDYEKIVALDPQVLVVPKNGKVEESVEKLESFGIKVLLSQVGITLMFRSRSVFAASCLESRNRQKNWLISTRNQLIISMSS